jgi:hypothetical protein
MRWAGHEAHMRKNRNVDSVLRGHRKERDHFGRSKDNSKLDLQHADKVWTGLVWLRDGTEASSYEHCNKLPSSIQCRKFLV